MLEISKSGLCCGRIIDHYHYKSPVGAYKSKSKSKKGRVHSVKINPSLLMMRECQVLTIAPRSDKKTSWFEVCIAQICNLHAHKDFGMKKSTPL